MKAFLVKLKPFVHWLLLILIVVYIISGLGITYYKIIEQLTFGLLTKALSFKIHSYLLMPFLILLILHIIIVIIRKRK
jgi:hypothetical protein